MIKGNESGNFCDVAGGGWCCGVITNNRCKGKLGETFNKVTSVGPTGEFVVFLFWRDWEVYADGLKFISGASNNCPVDKSCIKVFIEDNDDDDDDGVNVDDGDNVDVGERHSCRYCEDNDEGNGVGDIGTNGNDVINDGNGEPLPSVFPFGDLGIA